MKRITFSIVILFLILLGLYHYWLELGKKEWDYLKANSVWEYKNAKEEFSMVLELDEKGAGSVNYINKGKEGEWTFGILMEKGIGKRMIFGKIQGGEEMIIWTGWGVIKPDKIIIENIEMYESLEYFIQIGICSKDIKKEMLPEGIQEIELIRVE